MAEHVTQFDPLDRDRNAELDRLREALECFPGTEPVRSADPRDAEGVFALLKAAKDRLPIGQVRRHVCRHDEGVGDCSSAPGETA